MRSFLPVYVDHDLTVGLTPSYLGKSTGSNALSVWAHHLKTIEITDYQSEYYNGSAFRMGAGVQAFEVYAAVDQRGLAVVGGECSTVGLAGNYTQGGGHSALSSMYGLAADQTLEWEVVTGEGQLIRASPTENTDMYWALSGGGGGTYGVVWALTSKAHKDIPLAGFNLTFSSTGISKKDYYNAIGYYHTLIPNITRAGASSIHYFSNSSFTIGPITFPGEFAANEVQQLLQPFTDYLTSLDIKYDINIIQFPGYLSEFNAMFPDFLDLVGVTLYGGRLIPRSVIENNNEGLTAVVRSLAEDGCQIAGVGINVSLGLASSIDNTVLPVWRDSVINMVVNACVRERSASLPNIC